MTEKAEIQNCSIPLNRDLFLRTLIRELAGTLEEVVGYEEAAGYISLVGQKMGDWINDLYKKELGVKKLSRQQVGKVLIDLKEKIGGNFFLIEQNDERIVLGNNTCPFEDKVIARPSICMLTSNVFGVITAGNLSYAKVVLSETIADNKKNCKVIIYLKSTPEAEAAEGREYFGD